MLIKFVSAGILFMTLTTSLVSAAGLENTLWRTSKLTGIVDPVECKKAPTGIVSFKRCGPSKESAMSVCGSIIAFNPNDSELGVSRAELAEAKDIKNPQQDLRERAVLGLRLFSDITKKGDVLSGEAYSPCHGSSGKICIEWDGQSSELTQWGCAAQASCKGLLSVLCTKKYRWEKVDAVPEDWITGR